jgi:hypothetical protein
MEVFGEGEVSYLIQSARRRAMKKLSKKDSERRVTLAANDRDDDGELETNHPVLGLRIVSSGARYLFEELLQSNSRRQIWVIGSSKRCDIRIDDEKVSAMHVMLIRNRRTRRLSIYDLKSTNGVRINRVKITTAELEPGDTLALGDTHLYAFGAEDKAKDIIISASKHQQFIETAVEVYGGVRPAAEGLDIKRGRLRYWIEKGQGGQEGQG